MLRDTCSLPACKTQALGAQMLMDLPLFFFSFSLFHFSFEISIMSAQDKFRYYISQIDKEVSDILDTFRDSKGGREGCLPRHYSFPSSPNPFFFNKSSPNILRSINSKQEHRFPKPTPSSESPPYSALLSFSMFSLGSLLQC